MELNLKLRELRKEIKLRQCDVAEHLDVSVSTYTKYETGDNQPDLTMLIKLSRFYKVSTDYLLGLSKTRRIPTITLSEPAVKLNSLFNSLSEHNQIALIERAETLLEFQSDSNLANSKISPKKGA